VHQRQTQPAAVVATLETPGNSREEDGVRFDVPAFVAALSLLAAYVLIVGVILWVLNYWIGCPS
jgi:hypothetical protein